MDKVEQLASLLTIGAGAAVEKFAAELQAVLENIRDPNTQPDATRKIILEFQFKPDPNRELVATTITARASFAATKPVSEVMYVATHQGAVVATVVHGPDAGDPRQGLLSLQRGNE